jgi:hypothetical protein
MNIHTWPAPALRALMPPTACAAQVNSHSAATYSEGPLAAHWFRAYSSAQST